MSKKQAIIIGAGPAGLTAAYELLEKTDIVPVIFEESGLIGGISRTIDYKGNKIDIGGHRFFSKSEKVVSWWQNMLPLSGNPDKTDKITLLRQRVSRILFLGKLFDYPISLNVNTLANLGVFRVLKTGCSYLKAKIFPIKSEKNLEEFFINRFGNELYQTFFKDYTEKVWGVSCKNINAEWGAQRIKGLSIAKAVSHFIKKIFFKDFIKQNKIETSLIEQFMYPKYGPGQLWEEVAEKILQKGGKIYLNHKVTGIKAVGNSISAIIAENQDSGIKFFASADYYFSSMAIKDLISCFDYNTPDNIKEIADGLMYRDFITVGLLLNSMKLQNNTSIKTINNIIPDNWIYVQETSVKLGRIQVFNNWSPYLVKDLNKIWLGLEYFCNEGDDLWNKKDEEFKEFAVNELVKLNIIDKNEVIDSVIIRYKKAYPAYFGTYPRFDEIKEFLNRFENLFPLGRNGMHRYNNMDHSMLTAMQAVENIINKEQSKENIWNINTEKIYHENKNA
ncbi:MAG TPA: NAD(P)/FAD-dependent oxidoreductase [Candidatus Gastranaerophilales bacterium]|nr:NAD(P)/FAD-dependent oxidoreductase [Candidatus Gastranaerophilales bacterium]